MNEYKEILTRYKEQNIDITGCHIYLVEPSSLDGVKCLKGTLSQDKEWICIPTLEYCPDFDEDTYVPKCYEIKESFKTYLKNDTMWYLVQGYVLYDGNRRDFK